MKYFDMDQSLPLVTDWLLCASSLLEPNYFQLPVEGKENPKYRERVYCYELYHLWRLHWIDNFPFSLCGEVDKEGHPIIRGKPKPDFLVHIPGKRTNLLVVEVKPGNARNNDIIDDLEKLTYFRREIKDKNGEDANYYAAYFWIYGLSIKNWYSKWDRILQKIRRNSKIDYSLISFFVHESPGSPAKKVPMKIFSNMITSPE